MESRLSFSSCNVADLWVVQIPNLIIRTAILARGFHRTDKPGKERTKRNRQKIAEARW